MLIGPAAPSGWPFHTPLLPLLRQAVVQVTQLTLLQPTSGAASKADILAATALAATLRRPESA